MRYFINVNFNAFPNVGQQLKKKINKNKPEIK